MKVNLFPLFSPIYAIYIIGQFSGYFYAARNAVKCQKISRINFILTLLLKRREEGTELSINQPSSNCRKFQSIKIEKRTDNKAYQHIDTCNYESKYTLPVEWVPWRRSHRMMNWSRSSAKNSNWHGFDRIFVGKWRF